MFACAVERLSLQRPSVKSMMQTHCSWAYLSDIIKNTSSDHAHSGSWIVDGHLMWHWFNRKVEPSTKTTFFVFHSVRVDARMSPPDRNAFNWVLTFAWRLHRVLNLVRFAVYALQIEWEGAWIATSIQFYAFVALRYVNWVPYSKHTQTWERSGMREAARGRQERQTILVSNWFDRMARPMHSLPAVTDRRSPTESIAALVNAVATTCKAIDCPTWMQFFGTSLANGKSYRRNIISSVGGYAQGETERNRN